MEIVDGIYRFEGVKGANSYLYISDGEALVIDTGMPKNGEKIVRQIRDLSIKTEKIKLIILTHSDIDHSGSAAELKRLTGANVGIHGGDAPSLSGERAPKRVKGVIGVIFKIMIKFMKFQTIKPDVILKDGDGIVGLKVIHCPGHTKGSICLYKPGKVLFAGDALRTDKKGELKGPSKRMSLDIKEAMESVRKITGLEFETLLPGHGKPVLHEASKKVRKLIENAG